MSVTRFLIIRFSSIGDIVLTTPVIRQLKNSIEGEAEIHYFTKKEFAPILASNPNIDKLHLFGENLSLALDEIEKIPFDYVIDLQNNYRSAMAKKRVKTLNFTVDKMNWKKYFLTGLGIRRFKIPHIVDRYLETIKGFGLKDDGLGLDFFVPQNDMIIPRSLDGKLDGKIVAFAVGGKHLGKVMPQEMQSDICSKINAPIALVGHGDADDEVAQYCAERNPNVVNLVNKLSLNQSASVVAQAEVVLAGDTGLMHIAAAFGKKIVSVWGCTSPELGMSAYRSHESSIIIEPTKLRRRPCSKLGNRCRYGEVNRCITHNRTAVIAEAVNQRLS